MKYRLKYISDDRTWYGPSVYDDFMIAHAVAKSIQETFPHYAIEIEQMESHLRLVR